MSVQCTQEQFMRLKTHLSSSEEKRNNQLKNGHKFFINDNSRDIEIVLHALERVHQTHFRYKHVKQHIQEEINRNYVVGVLMFFESKGLIEVVKGRENRKILLYKRNFSRSEIKKIRRKYCD